MNTLPEFDRIYREKYAELVIRGVTSHEARVLAHEEARNAESIVGLFDDIEDSDDHTVFV